MRRTLVAAITLAATAAMAGGVQLANASATARHVQLEKFRVLSTSPAAAKLSTLATGTFTEGGYERPGPLTNKVVFPRGTFDITHHVTRSSMNFKLGSCLSTESQHGTYYLSGGTRRYAGIRGTGTYSLHITAVYARDKYGLCTSKMVVFQQVIIQRGTVRR